MYTITIEVTESQIQDILDTLNKYKCDDNPITMEEVKNNPELLEYLCTEPNLNFNDIDPTDHFSNDGWCDVSDHRWWGPQPTNNKGG